MDRLRRQAGTNVHWTDPRHQTGELAFGQSSSHRKPIPGLLQSRPVQRKQHSVAIGHTRTESTGVKTVFPGMLTGIPSILEILCFPDPCTPGTAARSTDFLLLYRQSRTSSYCHPPGIGAVDHVPDLCGDKTPQPKNSPSQVSGVRRNMGSSFLFFCFFFLIATYMLLSLIKIFLFCHNAFQSYISSTVIEIHKLPAPNLEANRGVMDPKVNFRKGA